MTKFFAFAKAAWMDVIAKIRQEDVALGIRDIWSYVGRELKVLFCVKLPLLRKNLTIHQPYSINRYAT